MLLFAFAACSVAVPTVSAQESGWWIGGRVGYWHDKVEGVTSSGFALAPEFGHDFNAKWSLGGVLGFDYRKTGNTSAEVFVIEPYARYKYFSRGPFHALRGRRVRCRYGRRERLEGRADARAGV